jgi:hypothetical protein
VPAGFFGAVVEAVDGRRPAAQRRLQMGDLVGAEGASGQPAAADPVSQVERPHGVTGDPVRDRQQLDSPVAVYRGNDVDRLFGGIDNGDEGGPAVLV